MSYSDDFFILNKESLPELANSILLFSSPPPSPFFTRSRGRDRVLRFFGKRDRFSSSSSSSSFFSVEKGGREEVGGGRKGFAGSVCENERKSTPRRRRRKNRQVGKKIPDLPNMYNKYVSFGGTVRKKVLFVSSLANFKSSLHLAAFKRSRRGRF